MTYSPHDPYEGQSDEELIAAMRRLGSTESFRADGEVLKAELSRRSGEKQMQAGAQLAAATDKLVTATERLGTATFLLVGVTAILALAAIAQVVAVASGGSQ